jgi:hypothetical protein
VGRVACDESLATCDEREQRHPIARQPRQPMPRPSRHPLLFYCCSCSSDTARPARRERERERENAHCIGDTTQLPRHTSTRIHDGTLTEQRLTVATCFGRPSVEQRLTVGVCDCYQNGWGAHVDSPGAARSLLSARNLRLLRAAGGTVRFRSPSAAGGGEAGSGGDAVPPSGADPLLDLCPLLEVPPLVVLLLLL